jgi:hypothetical protein
LLYFPQLSSGAVSQFPVRRRLTTRTVSNESAGGDSIRMADTAPGTSWQLQFKSLTNDEWAGIRQLFEASEGRLSMFTFLDPTDNLLMWSQDWTKQVWACGPLINLTGGVADPVGGTEATQITNTGQGAQRMMQSIEGASNFQYCFTIYARSDPTALAKMVVSTTNQEATRDVVIGPAWTRLSQVASLSDKQDAISFGLELAAGTRISIFGAQVEAQGGAGEYKKTTDRAGVYSRTRFDTDSLSVTAEGSDCNSCVVKLTSGE